MPDSVAVEWKMGILGCFSAFFSREMCLIMFKKVTPRDTEYFLFV
jgi:hypothetical protein